MVRSCITRNVVSIFSFINTIRRGFDMLPEEVQELLAKLLLFIFSIFVLCFGKARAEELSLYKSQVDSPVGQDTYITR